MRNQHLEQIPNATLPPRRSQAYYSRGLEAGTSACRCNLHFVSWHQTCAQLVQFSLPFLSLGPGWVPISFTSAWAAERPKAGEGNGGGQRRREKSGRPALPSLKMAAQASAGPVGRRVLSGGLRPGAGGRVYGETGTRPAVGLKSSAPRLPPPAPPPPLPDCGREDGAGDRRY